MASHIALHEIGAPLTPGPLSFAHNETRNPEFRAINPAVQRINAIERAIGYELPA